MAYGIEIINNSNKVVIDENFELLQVISIQLVETVPNTADMFLLDYSTQDPACFMQYEIATPAVQAELGNASLAWQWFAAPASSTWTGEVMLGTTIYTPSGGSTQYLRYLMEDTSSTGGTSFYLAKCIGIKTAEILANEGVISLPNGSGYGVEVFGADSGLVFTSAGRLVGPIAASKIDLDSGDIDATGVKIGGVTLPSSSYPRWAWMNGSFPDYSTGTVKSPGNTYGHVIEWVSNNDIRVRYRQVVYSGFLINIQTTGKQWAVAELGDFSWW